MTTEEKTYLSIIENNKGIFIGICNVYTNSNEDFKDLYQDILLNIWKALPSFNNKSKLSTWLYRIALNVSIRYNTKRKKGNPAYPIDFITPWLV